MQLLGPGPQLQLVVLLALQFLLALVYLFVLLLDRLPIPVLLELQLALHLLQLLLHVVLLREGGVVDLARVEGETAHLGGSLPQLHLQLLQFLLGNPHLVLQLRDLFLRFPLVVLVLRLSEELVLGKLEEFLVTLGETVLYSLNLLPQLLVLHFNRSEVAESAFDRLRSGAERIRLLHLDLALHAFNSLPESGHVRFLLEV